MATLGELVTEPIIHFKSGNKIAVPESIAVMVAEVMSGETQKSLRIVREDNSFLYCFNISEIEYIGVETIKM